MEPAAAVVTGVHDKGVAVAVFAESLAEDFAERRGVHPLDVNVAYAAAGEFLHYFLIAAHPAGVGGVGITAGRSYIHFEIFAGSLDAQKHPFASLALQSFIPGLSCRDLPGIHGHDDIAGLQGGSRGKQFAAGQELLYPEAGTFKVLIEEHAEMAGGNSASVAIAAAGVGTVEFAQHLAQKLLEGVVIGYVREELAVVFADGHPIHAVHACIVELLAHLFPAMVEDIFALRGREILEFSLVLDGFKLVLADFDLLDAASGSDVETLAVGGRIKGAANVL